MGVLGMPRKILCESCGSVLNEDILIAKNSTNACPVCGASLGGDDFHAECDEPQSESEEELVTWYYYSMSKAHSLNKKLIENNPSFKLEYKFRAPDNIDRAKEILRKEYNPLAFINTISEELKTDAQWKAEGKCPRCHSSNIQIMPRRWSLLTGFLTNKVDRVCVVCGHRF